MMSVHTPNTEFNEDNRDIWSAAIVFHILKGTANRTLLVTPFLITIQNKTENLFVKTCTYIHHHTKHLIQLYTRDIQL